MLHNPNWQKPTPEVFSTEGLVTWLEKQPSDKTYPYIDGNQCLIAQYLTAAGLENVHITSHSAHWGPVRDLFSPNEHHKCFPRLWNEIAGRSTGPSDHTFGKAKERARKLLVTV